jgi:hypothetical protein
VTGTTEIAVASDVAVAVKPTKTVVEDVLCIKNGN